MKKIGLLLLLSIIMLFTGCQSTNQQTSNIENTEINIVDKERMVKNLNKEDVKEVTIYASAPWKVEFVLTSEQVSALVDVLNEIEIGEQISEQDIVGGMIQYQITKTDGSVMKFQDMRPYIVIDDNWYKVSEEFSRKLDELSEELLQDYE